MVFILPAAAIAKPGDCKIVNQTAGGTHTSLQAAVTAATAGDTLRVKGVCTGTTIIAKELTIRGQTSPGYGSATLDGQHGGTVLTIDGASVVLDALRVTNGTGQERPEQGWPEVLWGGGIYNKGGTVALLDSVVTMNAADEGAGIFNNGTMTVTNSTIVGNEGDFGAGIGNASLATLTVIGSTLKDNTAPGDGGGIFAYYGSTVTVSDSTIVGNYAGWGDGGGVRAGAAVISGSTVSNNHAEGYGGGVFADELTITNSVVSGNSTGWGDGSGLWASTLIMSSTLVTGNTAGRDGGIVVNGGTITDSVVSGNTASGNGGGIAHYYANLTLIGTTVANNIAGGDGGGIHNPLGSVTFTNSALTGNEAAGNGGGLWAKNDPVSFTDSTVSYNTAVDGGGIYMEPTGTATLTMTGTTFVGNVPNDCSGTACPT